MAYSNKPNSQECAARQHSDQMGCAVCDLGWDVNDPCPPHHQCAVGLCRSSGAPSPLHAPPAPPGAIRFNAGKPQLSLVLEMRRALEGASRGLEEGVIKYGRGNYAKGDGLDLHQIADSLTRHMIAWLSGEDLDQDSKDSQGNPIPHVDKILTNALMLSELWHKKQEE